MKIHLFPDAECEKQVLFFFFFSFLLNTAEVPHTLLCPLHSVFPKWAQRVRFKSRDPIQNSSLVLMNTDISDEGIYICRISSFPDGNFETEISLKLWSESIFYG